jgi:hypothetical protein
MLLHGHAYRRLACVFFFFQLFSLTAIAGKIFDSNEKSKKKVPLKFKVGTGRVIKAWDHALLTMSLHERIRLTVEPAWCASHLPKNSFLTI